MGTFMQAIENRPRADVARDLADFLVLIERYDQAKEYDNRYLAVCGALVAACACGFRAGVRVDPAEPEWPVIYIELPTGQVSWHLPQHPVAWDGHDTEEKYRRCRAFIEGE